MVRTLQAKAIAKLPAGENWLHYSCSSGAAVRGTPMVTTWRLVTLRGMGRMRLKEAQTLAQNGLWRKKTPAGLAWRSRRKVEAAGIEPSGDIGASADLPCDCVNCQECCAAYALHGGCFESRFLARHDADVQRVMAAWARTPATVRAAVATLLGLSK